MLHYVETSDQSISHRGMQPTTELETMSCIIFSRESKREQGFVYSKYRVPFRLRAWEREVVRKSW
jgi:hypothetical protein